jgi:hypothetical protein
MKSPRILSLVLALSPMIASAHPGHEASALHLHMGLPSAANTLDLRLTFAALVLALGWQALRLSKRR